MVAMTMAVLIAYLLLIFCILLFLIGISIFTVSLIWSSIMGAPYVPSNGKEIKEILKLAHLKKGSRMYELGCGDARTIRWAVRSYGVRGWGIDINPVLIVWARLLARLQGIKHIHLQVGNVYHTDLRNADVVYLFLMPEMVAKMRPLFAAQLKKDTLVISHGFPIPYLKKMLEHTREHRPFPTYYYRFQKGRLTKDL